MEAPEAFAAFYVPWYRGFRLSLAALAVLGFAILCYLGLVLGSLAVTIGGAALALGALAVFAHLFLNLRLDRPVLRMDGAGFHDARLRASIPWGEIADVAQHRPGTQVFLDILAERPERFIAPGRGFARVRPLRRRVVAGAPLRSNCAVLDVPGERVVAAAQAWHSFAGKAA